MWLVNCTTLKLEYFIGSKIPKYAILSHTWEDEQVTFQELDRHHPRDLDLSERRLRQHIYDTTPKGYHKIWETCFLSKKRGFQHAWIDTCCINNDSSAELTESINSMFQWYQNAEECYVFLSDLPSETSAEEGFLKCKWFTRGWTLQELIAPKQVLFYNQAWKYVGSKATFCDLISEITNIDKRVLQGINAAWDFSTATRMSWAAQRQTTRIEDIAYCLLGIFQVNLPMIYGEGANAFFRLQEEIVRRTNDLTVLAWNQKEGQELPCSLFASSPAGFADTGFVEAFHQQFLAPVFSITNKGLRFE
ncbi:HET-domain-containing protein, partial [Hyaloscypha hepaticicola]